MAKEELIKELIDFVEGRTDIKNFYSLFILGRYDKLFNVYIGEKARMFGKSSVLEWLKKYGIHTSRARSCFMRGVSLYLFCNGYEYIATNKYHEEWSYKVDIQPSYINIEDDELLNKYINEAPKGLNKTETKKWIKNRIKQDFKYEKTPPRWVQDPEWPIIDGVPLIFKKQSKMTLEDERVYYTFYHPQTLEETIVVQFY